MLGFLIICAVILGGAEWNSRFGKLTGPVQRGLAGVPEPWRLSWFRKIAGDAPAAQRTSAEVQPGAVQPGIDEPPSVIHIVPASYTAEARNAGFHGRVFVTVYVDALGVPADLEATSLIPFGLERTIKPAVFEWRFRPALSHGAAVAGKTIVEVPFR